MTGISFGESPRWHDGRFWMCDWLAGEILVFDSSGYREVVARVQGLPFSIDWLPAGEPVAHPEPVVVPSRRLAHLDTGREEFGHTRQTRADADSRRSAKES